MNRYHILVLIFVVLCASSLSAMRRSIPVRALKAIDSDDRKRVDDCLSRKRLGEEMLEICRKGLRGRAGIFIVENYLKQNPDVEICDKQGTILMWLAFHGCLGLVKRLVEYGASLEGASPLGYTALHAAAQEGHLEIVTYLLAQGANPNAQAVNGSTPLHLAAQNGKTFVVCGLLLPIHGSKFLKDELGREPLHLADWKGHHLVCAALIESGADVKACATGGITPLHAAAMGGHTKVFGNLLKRGADFFTKTEQGKSVADCALMKGHKVFAKGLEKIAKELSPRTSDPE